MQWFAEQNAIFQAFLATLFTWGVTAMGAALVFLAKDFSKKMLDVMLGFAGGVMMAASYWSLLAPAIEMSGDLGTWSFVPAAVGFVLGAAFLRLVDVFLPHLHLNAPMSEAEGVKTSWQRSTLLVTAITLHNIPEGLAVGVAFGAVAAGLDSASLAGAVSLALGIGIQNFPEGTAVSVPLRREGMSRMKAFLYGQASGMVEPVAAVLGAAAVLFMRPVLPYALAFAAGAMIFVVVEEVIPESQASGNGDLATMGVVSGFTLMMALDVALG
ncbi:ZIP family metal transporter [Pseudodesulfovibrio indicus]|jgi:ZIP family zinc transporter|uniref:Dihydroorotate dehydrogenase n=1 Tax=Pseudodesulfovibrio indicus TaxID=1716143 RepID=A0A126QP58_9BACT|nr:ZIP family metal transporter [Pseudodesulfovibrio indicus]AMK11711.1 dihydroorotate dehydrogenase [Pseudodesulfovibrio indicus]TDT88242.1 ZIP family zinc transporter [Pseudodesulfovibrio indicus]